MARKTKAQTSSIGEFEWLLDAVEEATISSNCCVGGDFNLKDPGLVVQGVGPVTLPLTPKIQKALIARCRIAPFGKGTRTLVDASVRKTYELDASLIELGDRWNAAVTELAAEVSLGLGLPEGSLVPSLYKLLVYENGGFFKAHRDSEKVDRMVATLVIVLPNPFRGGSLVVRHGPEEQRFPAYNAAEGRSSSYVAFYADCEHQAESVYGGTRLALTYNLAFKTTQNSGPDETEPTDSDLRLARLMRSFIESNPTLPLVFALEHRYTEPGMRQELLKGTDRKLADFVVQAARQADCLVHLTQVNRHLVFSAHDDSDYGYYGRSRRTSPGKIEIDELIEGEMHGSDWFDLEGNRRSFGAIHLTPGCVVSETPIDEWRPTEEEYEGYTGNAGNTLERWYHRSAIVVWGRSHHYDILAPSCRADGFEDFLGMVGRFKRAKAKAKAELREESLRYARAIIGSWGGISSSQMTWQEHEHKPTSDFQEALLDLQDSGLIGEFLSKAAPKRSDMPLHDFVVAASDRYGAEPFAAPLRSLLVRKPSGHDLGLPCPRDFRWILALATVPTEEKDRPKLLRQLAASLVESFIAEPGELHPYTRGVRAKYLAEALPYLLRILVSVGDTKALDTTLDHIRSKPDDFPSSTCQQPTAYEVGRFCLDRTGKLSAPLKSWLSGLKAELKKRTAREPSPPADWRRPGFHECSCQWCTRLKSFLDDPAAASTIIRANEYDRQHMSGQIRMYELDVSESTDQATRPYGLVLRKGTAAYSKALAQYHKDCEALKLLASLPTKFERD